MRLTLLAQTTALSILAIGGVAQAQPAVQIQFGPSTPRMEFGTHVNVMELFGDASRTIGGRFAKRHADWMVSEFAFDRTAWKYEARTSRVLVASMRFQSPTTRIGRRPFISLGVARAGGMSFAWSPVLSSGVQHENPGGIAVFRAEVQLLVRGRSGIAGFERGRFLLGVAVGVP